MSKGSEDNNLYSRLTLGVVRSLEKRPGVCDVTLEEKLPVEKHILTSWEQKYSCLMPDDVKGFYLTSNGFRLKWSAKMNETRIPVGRLEVNPIEHLVRIGGVSSSTSADRKLPSLSDICGDNELDPDSKEANRPKFDHRSRIFELDPCDGYGKVCLVYNNTKPDEDQSNDGDIDDDNSDEFDYEEGIPASKADIWFLDRSLQWHHLADDFIGYYRLLLVHIGLPHWQYAFTDIGLPPQAKQWFNMYAPMRLEMQTSTFPDEDSGISKAPALQLDIAKVFKGKTDKKKQPPAQNNQLKKRPGAPSARSQTFMGRTASSQQLPKPSGK